MYQAAMLMGAIPVQDCKNISMAPSDVARYCEFSQHLGKN